MSEPSFRFVCVPGALSTAPETWLRDMLREGEVALLADDDGWPAVNTVAHRLELVSVALVRAEDSPERQADTVIAYAAALPLVWVAGSFSDAVTAWALDRGPMTLLVASEGALPDEERRRIDRFVAALGRQSE